MKNNESTAILAVDVDGVGHVIRWLNKSHWQGEMYSSYNDLDDFEFDVKPGLYFANMVYEHDDIDWIICGPASFDCNEVECHQQRDILESLYEAISILPCNGLVAIMLGAYQEISSLRESAISCDKCGENCSKETSVE